MKFLQVLINLVEDYRFELVFSILLILTAIDEFILAFKAEHWELSIEHGIMFLYLNLLLKALGKFHKAVERRRESRHAAE